jgi:GcrA cell cycle regulator
MVWGEETIRHLRDLWAQGLSTAEIGRRLGVSKNAIVGKAHRLDLDARPSPIRRDAAKPASERPASLPRMAGPTLPPLASAGAPTAVQVVISQHPVAQHPVVQSPVAPSGIAPSGIAPSAVTRSPVDQHPVVQSSVPQQPADESSKVQSPRATPLTVLPVATPSIPAVMTAPRPIMPSAPMQTRRSAPSCCWPIGEPGTKAFRFCDDTSLAGKPYCDEHAKLAYVRIRDRKEDAA